MSRAFVLCFCLAFGDIVADIYWAMLMRAMQLAFTGALWLALMGQYGRHLKAMKLTFMEQYGLYLQVQ